MSIEKSLYVRNVVPETAKPYSAPLSKAYRGLSSVAATNGNFSLYDIGLIKQDIINHFHIRQGERLENPGFGTIIWDLLFEPLTNDVKNAIVENVTDIINYDPRVKVDNVIVSSYEAGIQIECELTYLPYSIAETLRLRFDNENNIIS